MKPVDCHCHLEFDRFDEDREEVIERAKKRLDFVVSVGCNLEKNKETLKIAEKDPEFILANLGLHPTYTDDFDNLEEVKKLIRKENTKAVGEIGLDHYHVKDEETRKQQRKVFRELLDLAEELEKPVNIHSRDAEQEVLDILGNYSISNVLIHCFNGSISQAEEAVNQGFYIGVTTQVLYSNKIQRLVENINLENIVLETDSPFLYRGERNEPVNVLESAEKIAEIKDIDKDEVIEGTTGNAREIFLE